MKKFRSILFVSLSIAFLCSFFYNVGITHVGHNQRVIIAPERCEPGQLLKVTVSRLDTLKLESTEPPRVINVNEKYTPPRPGIEPEKTER